jgi:hypothetical protein
MAGLPKAELVAGSLSQMRRAFFIKQRFLTTLPEGVNGLDTLWYNKTYE